MMKCGIYDFETLGQKPTLHVVLSLAWLDYDEDRFINNPYDYDELISNTKYIKFDVEDQVKNYKRTIDPNTLTWWKSQGKSAMKVLKPSSQDKSISTLKSWLEENFKLKSYNKVFTRGNTFDPMFLASLLGEDPTPWWAIRDTRSYIDGMLVGSENPDNRFVPAEYADKFIAHDVRHDVVMDVMRMQVLTRAII